MKTRVLLSMLLFAALVLTACSPQELAALGTAENQPKVELQSGGAGQTGPMGDVEGNGPVRIDISGQGNQGEEDGGVISSNGEGAAVAQGSGQAGQAGLLNSSSSGSASGEAEQAKAVKWLTYTDQANKFSIQYPDSYVILPEADLSTENVSSGMVHQVRFQDRQLAEADTAALEQPQFTVEVFTFTGKTSVDSFIKSVLPFSNMTIEPYSYGKLTGLRASTNRLLAPNEFYFFTGNGMVYKLTPLGPYSTEMLQSFTLLP
jgi:hypothetical protein